MKVTFLDQKRITEQLKELMHSSDEYHWAVAWGTVNKLSDYLIANKAKIKRLTFGTHFYQSAPDLLEAFKDMDTVRVMPNDAPGTFHPKVYLFINGSNAAAIVGSANFTSGAMNNNHEAAVLIEGNSSDITIQEIKALVQQAWVHGEIIDQVFLDNYRLHYRATASHRRALEKQRKSIQPKHDAPHKELRYWSWDQYVGLVKNDKFNAYAQRIALLKEAHELFSRSKSFSELNRDERRAVAGLLMDGDRLVDDGVDNWGWFGSMRGMGDFQSIINQNNHYISDALDQIPLTGDISKEQFDEYKALFLRAFEGAARVGGVPTASRLLAIKRPDVFVCIDSQNKKGLGKDLGFAPSTLDFEKYWNEIVLPISESNWWQTQRPSGADGWLWDGRAAMLDSIYYVGNH